MHQSTILFFISQAEIENNLKELESLFKTREWRLLESRKFFRFIRETEEVAEWISEQTAIAVSEDYGKDVEHVELLIQVPDQFVPLQPLIHCSKLLLNLICTNWCLIAEV